MLRRIIVFVIILSLFFIGFHYFNPEATDNFIENIKEIPDKIFHKEKTTDISLTITGTTLHISTGSIDNLDDNEVDENTGSNMGFDVINSGEFISSGDNDSVQEDFLGELLLEDVENSENTGDVNTNTGVISGSVVNDDEINNDTGNIVETGIVNTGIVNTGIVETGTVDEDIKIESPTDNEEKKVYVKPKEIQQTDQDIIDTENLINTIIK